MTTVSSARDATQQVCSLHLGGRLFAVPIARVLEILGKPAIQPVPLAPDFVGGLVHYRGEVLTAISLRRLLGMDATQSPGDVLVFESSHGAFGLLVDSVGEVRSVSCADYEPNPSTLDSRWQALVSGAWKLPGSLLVALDAERLEPHRLVSAFAHAHTHSPSRPEG